MRAHSNHTRAQYTHILLHYTRFPRFRRFQSDTRARHHWIGILSFELARTHGTTTTAIMITSTIWRQIATAAAVPPTAKGAIAVAQALGTMALCAGSAMATNSTDRFILLDIEQLPDWKGFSLALVRTLVFPGLVEEVFWRVLFQTPAMPVSQIIWINAAFAAYHVVGSSVLAERLDGRAGARVVFRDPAFLSLAFILGNACSYAYIRAGYALWAPVVVHAVPVAMWLTMFAGEQALQTPGGLSAGRPSPQLQHKEVNILSNSDEQP